MSDLLSIFAIPAVIVGLILLLASALGGAFDRGN